MKMSTERAVRYSNRLKGSRWIRSRSAFYRSVQRLVTQPLLWT